MFTVVLVRRTPTTSAPLSSVTVPKIEAVVCPYKACAPAVIKSKAASAIQHETDILGFIKDIQDDTASLLS